MSNNEITHKYAKVVNHNGVKMLRTAPDNDLSDMLVISAQDYDIGTHITIRTPMAGEE